MSTKSKVVPLTDGALTWILVQNGRFAVAVVPNISPRSFRICQLLRYSPSKMGAVKSIEISIVPPGATSEGRKVKFLPPSRSPLTKTRRYVVFHAQVPAFFSRQTLVNELPGAKTEPSGTVRSSTNSIRSQPRLGVGVGDWYGVLVGVGVCVGVLVGVLLGVNVSVNVGVNVGVKVAVFVGVCVGVLLGVSVGVRDGVIVLVGVLGGVRVGVDVNVSVDEGVCVGVFVGVNVNVGVDEGVCVGVKVLVGVLEGVRVGVNVNVGVDEGV